MKKTVIIMICAILCLFLVSCADKNNTDDSTAAIVSDKTVSKLSPGDDTTDGENEKTDETTAADETTEKTVNWQTATVAALSEYAEDNSAVYSLYDMNSDKVPELIIRTGASSADMKYFLYDLTADSPKPVGFGMGSALLCGYGGNGIILQYARMGEETVTQYTLKDGKLTETQLFTRELPLGEDYASFTPLAQYAIGDFSGLSWNENPKDNNTELVNNIK